VALAFSIPLVGRLVDQHGSRKILLPSCTVFAILLALIPVLADQLWILFLLFALIGALGAGANALPYLRTISAWFDRRRALALGIAMGGSGTGMCLGQYMGAPRLAFSVVHAGCGYPGGFRTAGVFPVARSALG
jgi:MFS family permease